MEACNQGLVTIIKTSQLKSGFEAIEILPFNPARIPEEACAPKHTYLEFHNTVPFSENQENNDPNDSDAINDNENLAISPQENEDLNDSDPINASGNQMKLGDLKSKPKVWSTKHLHFKNSGKKSKPKNYT